MLRAPANEGLVGGILSPHHSKHAPALEQFVLTDQASFPEDVP